MIDIRLPDVHIAPPNKYTEKWRAGAVNVHFTVRITCPFMNDQADPPRQQELVAELGSLTAYRHKPGKIMWYQRPRNECEFNGVLRAALMAAPQVSGGGFAGGDFVKLSRTDNLLSTRTLTGQGRLVPLAYVEFLSFGLGFYNPALNVQAV